MNEELATLMQVETASPPPPGRWFVDAAPAFDWRPSVLEVGSALSTLDIMKLERHGKVVQAASLDEGLGLLHDARWDAVVVAPELRSEADGLRFVRAIKLVLTAEMLSARVVALRERYAHTPFFVAPLPRDFEFALFRSARDWYLGDARVTPLSEAVLRAVAS